MLQFYLGNIGGVGIGSSGGIVYIHRISLYGLVLQQEIKDKGDGTEEVH